MSHPEPTIPINLLKNLQKLFCNYLTQEGIGKGNDPYLYGEKLKAYLRRGAKPLPGITEYPNPKVGYGALCVGESIPEI